MRSTGEDRRVSQQAEEAGFHSVWSGDSYQDAFAVLAGHAVLTSTIRLGSGVAVWHRSPVGLVNSVTAIDEISGGRFILGLGAGPRERNGEWYGIDFSRPVGRMREYVDLFRRLWSSSEDAPVSFKGDFFEVGRYGRRRPPLTDHLPVYFGTVGTQMNRLAGQVADGVLFDTALSRRYLREVARPAIVEGAAKVGRDLGGFTHAGVVIATVDDDRDVAIQRAKRSVIWHCKFPHHLPAWESDGFLPYAERCIDALNRNDLDACYRAIPDEMVLSMAIAGTPDDVREQLVQYDGLLDVAQLSSPNAFTSPAELAENRRRLLATFA